MTMSMASSRSTPLPSIPCRTPENTDRRCTRRSSYGPPIAATAVRPQIPLLILTRRCVLWVPDLRARSARKRSTCSGEYNASSRAGNRFTSRRPSRSISASTARRRSSSATSTSSLETKPGARALSITRPVSRRRTMACSWRFTAWPRAKCIASRSSAALSAGSQARRLRSNRSTPCTSRNCARASGRSARAWSAVTNAPGLERGAGAASIATLPAATTHAPALVRSRKKLQSNLSCDLCVASQRDQLVGLKRARAIALRIHDAQETERLCGLVDELVRGIRRNVDVVERLHFVDLFAHDGVSATAHADDGMNVRVAFETREAVLRNLEVPHVEAPAFFSSFNDVARGVAPAAPGTVVVGIGITLRRHSAPGKRLPVEFFLHEMLSSGRLASRPLHSRPLHGRPVHGDDDLQRRGGIFEHGVCLRRVIEREAMGEQRRDAEAASEQR